MLCGVVGTIGSCLLQLQSFELDQSQLAGFVLINNADIAVTYKPTPDLFVVSPVEAARSFCLRSGVECRTIFVEEVLDKASEVCTTRSCDFLVSAMQNEVNGTGRFRTCAQCDSAWQKVKARSQNLEVRATSL